MQKSRQIMRKTTWALKQLSKNNIANNSGETLAFLVQNIDVVEKMSSMVQIETKRFDFISLGKGILSSYRSLQLLNFTERLFESELVSQFFVANSSKIDEFSKTPHFWINIYQRESEILSWIEVRWKVWTLYFPTHIASSPYLAQRAS